MDPRVPLGGVNVFESPLGSPSSYCFYEDGELFKGTTICEVRSLDPVSNLCKNLIC